MQHPKDQGLKFARILKRKKSPRDVNTVTRYKERHAFCELPWCHNPVFLGPHHIIFKSHGGRDTEGNLISLCERHHIMAHKYSTLWRPLLQEFKRSPKYQEK